MITGAAPAAISASPTAGNAAIAPAKYISCGFGVNSFDSMGGNPKVSGPVEITRAFLTHDDQDLGHLGPQALDGGIKVTIDPCLG
ncbi:hypothetical protein [Arthrobacter sp. M-10]|uniref:hypothetical protein n=1 Tax=Arthrobacter sp. M-10 TaxID=3233037 RepID=UPI003F8F9597